MTSVFERYSQFYKSEETEQRPDQVVDITNWSFGEFDPYSEGSKPKYTVRTPSKVDWSFLIPRHRYLFKKGQRRSSYVFHEQFWVEVAAYRIGRRLGIEVPPAFVACRKVPETGAYEYASLSEWFYDYPDSPIIRLDRGENLMLQMIPDFDLEKGRQHNVLSICNLFQNFDVRGWIEKWAKIFVFDALIGNTDRHQDNWQVLSHFGRGGILRESLSPAFDNGTAMGYEILEKSIPKTLANLEAYINRGRHHIRWGKDDAKPQKTFELLERFAHRYPQAKEAMAEVLLRDTDKVCEDLGNMGRFDILNPDYSLTPRRIELMTALFLVRHRKAKETLGI